MHPLCDLNIFKVEKFTKIDESCKMSKETDFFQWDFCEKKTHTLLLRENANDL